MPQNLRQDPPVGRELLCIGIELNVGAVFRQCSRYIIDCVTQQYHISLLSWLAVRPAATGAGADETATGIRWRCVIP